MTVAPSPRRARPFDRHALLVLLALTACASPPGESDELDEIDDAPALPLATVADEIATADVVFLGEEHDNSAGHRAQLDMLRLLIERRTDVVLTMEMFERDVQPVLDQYLAGEIGEDDFRARARPWPNYQDHYRPLVELAKSKKLRVVAADAPRASVTEVSRKGGTPASDDPLVAKSTTAPRDAYWEAFRATMADHPGASIDEARMFDFYRAQCLRDDTMAESIVTALDADPRPLVVHVVGQFHVDGRMGTAARVQQRRPDLRLALLTMSAEPNVHRVGKDEFLLVVPPEPPKPKDAPEEGRPALGIMPDYDSDDGVGITSLGSGGPAERAGLLAGDVIVRVGKHEITDVQSYMTALGTLTIGAKVEVVVDRGGKVLTFEVEVGKRK